MLTAACSRPARDVAAAVAAVAAAIPTPLPPPDPKKSGVWRSDDSGKTWRIVSNQGDRWMYYSQVRIDPTNPEIAYQGGAPFFKTIDGGKTWRQLQGIPHSDHHAIWINPRDNQHILLGNDGGLNVSHDQGATWEHINHMALGQFYAISADMRKPYYVCGGLQDNGSWCGPSATRSSNGIMNSDWFRVGGGDGFYTANDPTDWTIALLGVAGRQHQPRRSPRRPLDAIRPRGPQVPGRGAGAPQPAPAAAARAHRPAPLRLPRLSHAGAGGTGRATPAARAAVSLRRQSAGQRRAGAACRHQLPLLLEHAVHPVAAQSAHRSISARSGCSARTIEATRGRRRPI